VNKLELQMVRLPHAADLPLPEYQTEHAAGLDLMAAVPADSPVIIEPRAYAMIPTGLCIALPPGTEAQVRPRSGLAAKHGVTVLNSPGTIDADYRGEIGIILINHGSESFVVMRGMRVAQLVVAKFVATHVRIVETLPETARGTGGFGSTGVKHEANQRKG
jgi:dUTP pyrophosphatase